MGILIGPCLPTLLTCQAHISHTFNKYDILAAVMTEVNRTFIAPKEVVNGKEVRHKLLEDASLGDLHSLIDWIATYQITLKGIKCPVSNTNNTIAVGNSFVSGACKRPKHCELFERATMTRICELYVHGGSAGSKVSV